MDKKKYSLNLEATIYTLEQLAERADTGKINIALAGRSNVGKSSLINALSGSRQLAKVSSTPGKTASINFYQVIPGDFYLVDLPGYGYAQKSKTERAKWAKLIDVYLNKSKDLHALAILLDCRLDPQNLDLDLIAYARQLGLEIIPILTKADKCNQKERAARLKQWTKVLQGRKPIMTSSTGPAMQRIGLNELWAELARIGSPEQPDEAEIKVQEEME